MLDLNLCYSDHLSPLAAVERRRYLDRDFVEGRRRPGRPRNAPYTHFIVLGGGLPSLGRRG